MRSALLRHATPTATRRTKAPPSSTIAARPAQTINISLELRSTEMLVA